MVKKYSVIEYDKNINKHELESIFGEIATDNAHVDAEILYSLYDSRCDFLISEDFKLRKRVFNNSKLNDRTFSLSEFLVFIKKLFKPDDVFVPSIQSIKAHRLNEKDNIFDSLKQSYSNFDSLFEKCKKEDRDAWVIFDDNNIIAAIVIIKPVIKSIDKPKRLKVCTFKVSDNYRGNKLGELLLKKVFYYCLENSFKSTYLTVRDTNTYLTPYLNNFGFVVSSKKANNEDYVLSKTFKKPTEINNNIIDFHIKYSPWHKSDSNIKKYLIPIKHEFYNILFPELHLDTTIMNSANNNLPGNTIKKVYLSKANNKELEPGSIIIFYCSAYKGKGKKITSIGIVESSTRTNNLDECLNIVGKRSVYTAEQLQNMTNDKTGVLIIDFRLAYHVKMKLIMIVFYQIILLMEQYKGL